MVHDEVKWLDGKQSHGKYVLEMVFADGGKGYLKNESKNRIEEQYEFFWNCEEVVQLTIFDTNGQWIVSKAKPSTFSKVA
jgi:hypothetical protein